jgi:hypothetical protein
MQLTPTALWRYSPTDPDRPSLEMLMTRTARPLVATASILAIVSLIGFVLCLIFQWPSQFVLGQVADSRVTLSDVMTGTVLSPPLVPWIILVVAARLARSRRWWGTVAIVALSLLGMVFVFGGWGEAFGPANPHVPRSVLLLGGIAWMLLGMLLPVFGIRELLARLRHERLGPSASAASS